MRLYRVFPWVTDAAAREAGGPLYAPLGGQNRIDNPALYRVLYLCSDPEAAVAEWLGRFPVWKAKLLKPPQHLPHALISLASYETGDEPIVDLDNARTLLSWDLRPSHVVTRDYMRSQDWAGRIFANAQGAAGIRWWSFYNPDWGTFGRWHTDDLTVLNIEPLTLDHPALVAAARAIVRKIERPRFEERRVKR